MSEHRCGKTQKATIDFCPLPPITVGKVIRYFRLSVISYRDMCRELTPMPPRAHWGESTEWKFAATRIGKTLPLFTSYSSSYDGIASLYCLRTSP